MNDFSYDYYLHMIERLKSAIPLMDFSKVSASDQRFFLLRHDIEFSVEKAYELAKIEHDRLGISSSYFFQVRNYSYNALAFKNVKLIKAISDMGHKIGLHVNTSGLSSLDDIKSFIKNDVNILQNGVGLPIDRFSFHRPSHALLALNINIDRLINAYDKRFFHFYSDKPPELLNVSYFSDSQHRWKYGNPLSALEQHVKKIQLLIHPYSWSRKGMDNTHNFKELIKEKQKMMLQAINDECKHFPKELLSNENI